MAGVKYLFIAYKFRVSFIFCFVSLTLVTLCNGFDILNYGEESMRLLSYRFVILFMTLLVLSFSTVVKNSTANNQTLFDLSSAFQFDSKLKHSLLANRLAKLPVIKT